MGAKGLHPALPRTPLQARLFAAAEGGSGRQLRCRSEPQLLCGCGAASSLRQRCGLSELTQATPCSMRDAGRVAVATSEAVPAR